MGSEHTKVRAGIYVEKEILNQADGLLETANVRSRNEFVAEALLYRVSSCRKSRKLFFAVVGFCAYGNHSG